MAVAEPVARQASGRGRLWQSLAGVAISLAFLIWALWGIKPAEVLHHIRRAHAGWFILSVVLTTLTFPIRALQEVKTARHRVLRVMRLDAGRVTGVRPDQATQPVASPCRAR